MEDILVGNGGVSKVSRNTSIMAAMARIAERMPLITVIMKTMIIIIMIIMNYDYTDGSNKIDEVDTLQANRELSKTVCVPAL